MEIGFQVENLDSELRERFRKEIRQLGNSKSHENMSLPQKKELEKKRPGNRILGNVSSDELSRWREVIQSSGKTAGGKGDRRGEFY